MYANNIRIYIPDATIRSKGQIIYGTKIKDIKMKIILYGILNVIKNVNENVVFRFLFNSYFAYYLYNTQNRGAHPKSTINTRVCFILPPNFSYF